MAGGTEVRARVKGPDVVVCLPGWRVGALLLFRFTAQDTRQCEAPCASTHDLEEFTSREFRAKALVPFLIAAFTTFLLILTSNQDVSAKIVGDDHYDELVLVSTS